MSRIFIIQSSCNGQDGWCFILRFLAAEIDRNLQLWTAEPEDSLAAETDVNSVQGFLAAEKNRIILSIAFDEWP
jgi:hypothetical protein